VKYTSLQSLGSLLGAACLVVACASSDDSDNIPAADSGMTFAVDSGTPDTGTGYDSGYHAPDTSVATEDTGPPTSTSCSGHCAQDSDCTSVCTPPSGDVACCDTATSMCYVASGVCQASTSPPEGDSGMPGGY
jgi:hypothetical protein